MRVAYILYDSEDDEVGNGMDYILKLSLTDWRRRIFIKIIIIKGKGALHISRKFYSHVHNHTPRRFKS